MIDFLAFCWEWRVLSAWRYGGGNEGIFEGWSGRGGSEN